MMNQRLFVFNVSRAVLGHPRFSAILACLPVPVSVGAKATPQPPLLYVSAIFFETNVAFFVFEGKTNVASECRQAREGAWAARTPAPDVSGGPILRPGWCGRGAARPHRLPRFHPARTLPPPSASFLFLAGAPACLAACRRHPRPAAPSAASPPRPPIATSVGPPPPPGLPLTPPPFLTLARSPDRHPKP
jgi:hypothetical protein